MKELLVDIYLTLHIMTKLWVTVWHSGNGVSHVRLTTTLWLAWSHGGGGWHHGGGGSDQKLSSSRCATSKSAAGQSSGRSASPV